MSSPSVNAVDQQKLEESGAQEGREGAQERERENERGGRKKTWRNVM